MERAAVNPRFGGAIGRPVRLLVPVGAYFRGLQVGGNGGQAETLVLGLDRPAFGQGVELVRPRPNTNGMNVAEPGAHDRGGGRVYSMHPSSSSSATATSEEGEGEETAHLYQPTQG